MARQTQVRSYNTVHNKMQSAQSAFSSRFMVILALAIAGGVIFFSARFYLAEKNGTASGDSTVATGSETTSDGATSGGSTSAGNSSSSGSSSSQGGNTSNGSAGSSGAGQSSNTGTSETTAPANGCTAPSAPEAACTTFRSIEAKGVTGNIYVAISFPRIPDTAAFIVDDSTWGQTSDSSATVKMAAFYDGIVDRVVLQVTLKGSNWVVTGFTQQ